MRLKDIADPPCLDCKFYEFCLDLVDDYKYQNVNLNLCYHGVQHGN